MTDPWIGLRALLTTDPKDVGCEATWLGIDQYAEIVLAGGDPEAQLPGITAHLASCDPCAEDYRGLQAAMQLAAADRDRRR